jgi:hypothetical protein
MDEPKVQLVEPKGFAALFRSWPVTSLIATQRYVRNLGLSGSRADTVNV